MVFFSSKNHQWSKGDKSCIFLNMTALSEPVDVFFDWVDEFGDENDDEDEEES